MLLLKALRGFCDMKYYREIAAFMKIKVPLLNEEITLAQDTVCVVHGIKRLEPDPFLPIKQQPVLPQTTNSAEKEQNISQQNQSLPAVHVAQPLYVYDQYSQQEVPFGKAVSLSQSLKMDLNLLRQGSAGIYPVLTMSAFRRHVYSQYYLTYVRRRGKEGWKSIRLGQRIEDNDIRNKISNIQRMIKAGERRFRLQARNDSDRSEKVITHFAKLFGKEVEPYLHTFKTAQRKKEERWVALMEFDDQVTFEIDQVNKKWRRRQFQQQAPPEGQHLQSLFEDADIRSERELYHAYKDLGIKMPPKFQKMAEEQYNISNDKMAFFRSVQEEQSQQEEWDSEEEARFKQNNDRFNKEYFKERTASEIMEEMEALKRSGYESQAHKVARFKQLKAQLQAIIKKHQDYDL